MEVVFQAEPTSLWPVDAWLNRQHHTFLYGPATRLVGKRRFMRTRSHAVRNRMRRLPCVARFGNACADQAVKLRQARSIAHMRNRFLEHPEQLIEKLVIARCQLAGAQIFGQISPIPIDTDPNFEQRWLILLDGAIAGRREGTDAVARPHQSKRARHLYFSAESNPQPMDKSFKHPPNFT